MGDFVPLTLAGIALLGIIAQWLAWRVKLPAILFLLLFGILAGPVTGLLKPDDLFDDLLFPIVSLSVAVILFEGALTLNFKEIGQVRDVVRRMVTWGALASWVVVAIATHYILDFSWEMSILFGAITVVTGPTVIVPLLRTVRPNAQVSNVLRWEGIIIDPVGALLAVVVYEFIVSQSQGEAFGNSLLLFGEVIIAGSILGAVGGYLVGLILRHHKLPEYLHNLATLSAVLVVFTVSNSFAHESGLLAVTVMGIWLANMRGVHTKDILHFKEHLTVVLISALFIILAARVEFAQIAQIGIPALLLLAVFQFVARPLSVLVSTPRCKLNWRERALLAWIAPRGIVAAAVASVFAQQLAGAGVADAELLVPLTFIVIIGTVVLQSATAGLVARMLGVADPEPNGFLIVGSNRAAVKIAKALQQHGCRVVMADPSWENTNEARMEGLKTFYGNAVSEHADQHLDLVGLGRMLAMTPQKEQNAVACMRYQAEFGRNSVYSIKVKTATKAKEDKQRIASEHRGSTLFDEQITFGKLASLMSKGAEIRSTKLTEKFTMSDFNSANPSAIALFAKNPEGYVEVISVEQELSIGEGWTLISLVPADAIDDRPVVEKSKPKGEIKDAMQSLKTQEEQAE